MPQRRAVRSLTPTTLQHNLEITVSMVSNLLGSRTTPHQEQLITPHKMKIMPKYCPPGPLSLGLLPLRQLPPGPRPVKSFSSRPIPLRWVIDLVGSFPERIYSLQKSYPVNENYTEHQKKLITSLGRRSPKNTCY